MVFKDIKQNFPIYILNKQSVELIKGKVVATTFPHPDQQGVSMPNNNYGTVVPPLGPSANQRMVVDLTIEANGHTATYTVSENASVNYAGDLVISTDQAGLITEVEAIKNAAEQALAPDRLEQLKQALTKSTALLSDLNPVFKQQQEYDQRFNKIEGSMEEIKNMMANFIKEFKS